MKYALQPKERKSVKIMILYYSPFCYSPDIFTPKLGKSNYLTICLVSLPPSSDWMKLTFEERCWE